MFFVLLLVRQGSKASRDICTLRKWGTISETTASKFEVGTFPFRLNYSMGMNCGSIERANPQRSKPFISLARWRSRQGVLKIVARHLHSNGKIWNLGASLCVCVTHTKQTAWQKTNVSSTLSRTMKNRNWF